MQSLYKFLVTVSVPAVLFTLEGCSGKSNVSSCDNNSPPNTPFDEINQYLVDVYAAGDKIGDVTCPAMWQCMNTPLEQTTAKSVVMVLSEGSHFWDTSHILIGPSFDNLVIVIRKKASLQITDGNLFVSDFLGLYNDACNQHKGLQVDAVVKKVQKLVVSSFGNGPTKIKEIEELVQSAEIHASGTGNIDIMNYSQEGPQRTAIGLTGTGDVTIGSNFEKSAGVAILNSGTGDFVAQSQITTPSLFLDTSGTGNIKLQGVQSASCSYSISGTGDITGTGGGCTGNNSGTGKYN